MRRDLTARASCLLVVLGCSLTAGCASASSGPAPEATTSSASTPPAASQQDVAVQSATEAVRTYYSVTDSLFTDASLPIDRAASVASGEELDQVRNQLQSQRARGERQTGSVVVRDVTATGADLGSPASVTLAVCLDVSGVDVLGADGNSVLAAERPDASQVDVTVVDAADRGWLVEQTDATEAPCTGS